MDNQGEHNITLCQSTQYIVRKRIFNIECGVDHRECQTDNSTIDYQYPLSGDIAVHGASGVVGGQDNNMVIVRSPTRVGPAPVPLSVSVGGWRPTCIYMYIRVRVENMYVWKKRKQNFIVMNISSYMYK